jgi:cytochrome c556
MKRIIKPLSFILLLSVFGVVTADSESRQPIKLPAKMQRHMMSNMRDHLAAINEILISMAAEEYDKAAGIAENRLGMSSLGSHGAEHMAKFMPENMQAIGARMHRAASRFALRAEEGEALEAYGALSAITTECVACHASYRVQ